MKVRFYNFFLVTSFLPFLLVSSPLVAKKEYTKTFEETFSLSADGVVHLQNKYGSVNVYTWEQPQVNIKVTIRVNTSSDSKADEVFNRVTINFDNRSDFVSATTEIDSQKSFWNFLKSWWGDADLAIDYEVSMPASAGLELENQYGNCEIENLDGNAILDIKYGNFTLDQVAGELKVDLSYGNGVVAKANKTIADLAYGKLRINDANTIDIESKFSKVTVESANRITSESKYDGYDLGDIGDLYNEGKYDKFKIAKLEKLFIETDYTQVDIDELLLSVSAEMTYGGLSVHRIGNTLENVDIESRYTGVELALNNVPSYQLTAETKYCKVHEPNDLTVEKQISEGSHYYLQGYKGSRNGAVSINIDAEYGGVKLR